MSGVNFNNTTNLPANQSGSVQAFTYKNIVVEDLPGGNEDNTSTSFVAVTGVPQGSFTAPYAGSYFFNVLTSCFAPSGNVTATFRLVIDLGTGGEQILGAGDIWKFAIGSTNTPAFQFGFTGLATLTAAAHTVDLQVKVDTNTMRRNTNSLTQIIVQG